MTQEKTKIADVDFDKLIRIVKFINPDETVPSVEFVLLMTKVGLDLIDAFHFWAGFLSGRLYDREEN